MDVLEVCVVSKESRHDPCLILLSRELVCPVCPALALVYMLVWAVLYLFLRDLSLGCTSRDRFRFVGFLAKKRRLFEVDVSVMKPVFSWI